MEIVTVKMIVPTKISNNVKTGASILQGLAKDATSKQIQKHIELIPMSSKELAMQAIKANKNIIIGLVTATAIIGSSYLIYKRIRKKQNLKITQEAIQFSKNLSLYLEQAEKGRLNYEILTNLTNLLRNLSLDSNGNIPNITLSSKQVQILINTIYNYTEELSEANSVKLILNKPNQKNKNSIVNLNDYLEAQKQIIKSA